MKNQSLFFELHKAYMDARRHKRNTINQLKFERNLEVNLLTLQSELENRTYQISPSVCFINEKPVKREIVAADFRDRVIHHFIYNRIYPVFDERFIDDCYSCRVGKGTLFGIKRAVAFCDNCKVANGWSLRLDIKGFFMAIDREILFDLVKSDFRLHNDNLTEFLIQKIVFNDPIANAVYKSPNSAWNGLPHDKSLKYSAPNCGLPIGNLTSQLFANIYLDPLDHFIKNELKIEYYGRYVDDMLLISQNKYDLLNAIYKVKEFLANKLKLTLHPKKIQLQPLARGFRFLGAYIKPNKKGEINVYAGKRIMTNFKECVFKPSENANLQKAKIQSYLGMLNSLSV